MNAAHETSPRRPSKAGRKTGAVPMPRSAAAARPNATSGRFDTPVDFGMAVHGAGNNPRFYSNTADSPAVRESGNGVTAGVKLGF